MKLNDVDLVRKMNGKSRDTVEHSKKYPRKT